MFLKKIIFLAISMLICIYSYAQKDTKCRLEDVPEGWGVIAIRYSYNSCGNLSQKSMVYEIVNLKDYNLMQVCDISRMPKGWELASTSSWEGDLCYGSTIRYTIRRITIINPPPPPPPPKTKKIRYTRSPLYQTIFTGTDGIFYGISKTAGQLYWHKLIGVGEEARWAKEKDSIISNGWLSSKTLKDGNKVGFRFVMGGDNGMIFAVTQNGHMLWYQYEMKGSEKKWNKYSGQDLGSGWDSYKNIFIGGDNNIFAIAKNGDMYLYKYNGFDNNVNWSVARQYISTGWESFWTVFADKGNQIYAVTKPLKKYNISNYREPGKLLLYKFRIENGNGITEAPIDLKSIGWTSYYEILGGEKGKLYGITKEGVVIYYNLTDDLKWGTGTGKRIDNEKFSTVSHYVYYE